MVRYNQVVRLSNVYILDPDTIQSILNGLWDGMDLYLVSVGPILVQRFPDSVLDIL